MNKVFFNGYDWFIARDFEHLAELVYSHYKLDLYNEDVIGDGWEELPDDKLITITDDYGEHNETYTAAKWCLIYPAGLLCSVNY